MATAATPVRCSQRTCVGEVSKIVRCEDADLWSTFVLEKKKLVKRAQDRLAAVIE
jgi:hypothetical protein